ncbi:MAG: Swt1 family HEPN domain-containing protein [Planctomycetota bacterium]|uniref:Swt1 family HEPN domain-containing protein n=1 Tax=uncultured Gimesia sp. TaxID=1678688 RepID=UPI00261846F3|nr:Swt1 family HEPN domain-containing protein [uncultured Gimesia sp.]
MAGDNERIKLTLELLGSGLCPIIEQEMKAVYQDAWIDRAKESFRNSPVTSQPEGEAIRWDAHSTLLILWDHWNSVFRNRLTPLERSFVGELREYRNRWAHQSQINTADTLRILDTASRLLSAAGATEEARQLQVERDKLLHQILQQQGKNVYDASDHHRERMRDAIIFLICAIVTVYVILRSYGTEVPAIFFAAFVASVFGFLAYQRWVTPDRPTYGAHECTNCGKIIYGEACPYCNENNLT